MLREVDVPPGLSGSLQHELPGQTRARQPLSFSTRKTRRTSRLSDSSELMKDMC